MIYKYHAIANMLGAIKGNFVKGKVYIVETSTERFGIVNVYDTDGNFIKQTRTDHFDKYTLIKER